MESERKEIEKIFASMDKEQLLKMLSLTDNESLKMAIENKIKMLI